MTTALLGYTGFVGSNLLRQNNFDRLYNSKNIEEIRSEKFELVVCAGVYAIKWLANKDPSKDMASIENLMDNLKEIETDRFILISTVDVYPQSIGMDEDSAINLSMLEPYGKHRKMLEEFIERKFDCNIIRLPGLFGEGLKKNIIYDFLNDNCLHMINPRSMFQFYNIEYLWKDIKVAVENNLGLVNLATEPVTVKDVASEAFGIKFKNKVTSKPKKYDFHTKHAKLWGKEGNYIYDRPEVLADMQVFVQSVKSRRKI
jgi:nucleoside-diphosphate-sugar epimerase